MMKNPRLEADFHQEPHTFLTSLRGLRGDSALPLQALNGDTFSESHVPEPGAEISP